MIKDKLIENKSLKNKSLDDQPLEDQPLEGTSSEFNIHIESNCTPKEYFKDIFRYRELFYFLAWRDILVRYKQAFFGIAWALFRPILNMILFTFLFHRIADLSSKEVSYPLFVLSGMLPWQLFSNAVIDTSNSLLNNAHLISKTYFPRILLPTSQIMLHLLDFAIGTVLLIALILLTGTPTGWSFFAFPLFVLLLVTFSTGLAILLSALTIRYRDVRFIIPFIVQFGIFISPVGYGSFVIPDKWQWLYSLNPLVGIIDGFRWAFFGTSTPYLAQSILTSSVLSLLTLMIGFFYFRKTERTFADQL